jgi:hypothetical protein
LSCEDLSMPGVSDFKKEYGRVPKNQEKWCATLPTTSSIEIQGNEFSAKKNTNINSSTQNLPGSRYVQLECRDGEVLETPCDGYRNSICVENFYDLNGDSEFNIKSEIRAAECVANKWQDCVIQTNEGDCEDQNARDCQWIGGVSILKDESGNSLATNEEGDSILASCVPKFAPGFDFWAEDADSIASCALASTECVAKYEVTWLRSKNYLAKKDIEKRISKCVENCYCIPGYVKEDKYPFASHDEWVNSLDLVCSSLGDCGDKTNYIGEYGEQRDDVLDTGNFIKKA